VGDAPRDPIEVIVEIPSGSRNKYEYDHARHRFVLDRILNSSVHYPSDYFFIENILADYG
jgi:inorganic pyrophosphatase